MAFKDKNRQAEYGSEWYKKNRERRSEQMRWYRLLRSYGITKSDYEKMLSRQGGCCAICGGTETRRASSFFHVDHCHETGVVRGLLCHKCNTAIGMLNDNPDLIRSALEYMEKSCLTTTP